MKSKLITILLGLIVAVCVGANNPELSVKWINDHLRSENKKIIGKNKQYPPYAIKLGCYDHTSFIPDGPDGDRIEIGFRSDGVVVWRVDEREDLQIEMK